VIKNALYKMAAQTILLIAMIFSTTLVPATSFAQGTNVERPPAGGPRRQLATIIYSGLGGAVLGLSTLSFYGRPQDKLANIAIGFAVGVIVGTVAVTYSAATNPDEFYGETSTAPLPSASAETDLRNSLLGPSPNMNVMAQSGEPSGSPEVSTSLRVLTF